MPGRQPSDPWMSHLLIDSKVVYKCIMVEGKGAVIGCVALLGSNKSTQFVELGLMYTVIQVC